MSGFRIDTSQLIQGLTETETRVRAAIGLYGDAAGRQLEATAKREAPWVDRTANARNSIKGGSEWQGDKLIICLSGNMNYSPYLEFCNEKRYSILYPTVKKLSPEIIRGMNRLLR